MCDLETSRICAPYMYDISSLRVNTYIFSVYMNTTRMAHLKIKNSHLSLSSVPHTCCSIYMAILRSPAREYSNDRFCWRCAYVESE